MLLHGVIDRLLLILKVCAMYCVSLVQLLFIVQSQKHWMICRRYWAISIQYSVDSIEQYPLNILWTVLSSIHWMFCGQYCAVSIVCWQYCAIFIFCWQYCPISIVWCGQYCAMSTVNMSKTKISCLQKHFHSPIAYRNGYTLTVGDCFLLLVFVVATVGLQSWAADQVLDRATTTNCCSCLVHSTSSLS